MLNLIDRFLNSITMYRLVLYYLIVLFGVGFILSSFGLMPFNELELSISSLVVGASCYVSNKIFAKLFNVQINLESFLITALILILVVTPGISVSRILFLVLVSLVAMASKFLLNIKGKHIFNPSSIALVITAFTVQGYASWWVASRYMFPFLLIGFLIVRKIRRERLVLGFMIFSLISTFAVYFLRGNFNIFVIIKNTFLETPILFFAFVMLTEPLTTPPTSNLQVIYGSLVGILFAPIHMGTFVTTPEIALSIGNIFSYLVSPKQKLILKLKEKIKLTDSVYDFVFSTNQEFEFKAGQYLEWTLGQSYTDSRGNRRYFSISSSPTEKDIRIGIKLPDDKASSFKREIVAMKTGEKITASQLAGDFTLSTDATKLVFIAGGIGVTPFRSMIKYLIDTNERRDIVLMYSEKNATDFVYRNVFNEAIKKMGLRVIYFETEKNGHMTTEIIKEEIPDYRDRTYYLSGPQGMVKTFEKSLSEMKVSKKQIKVDYFPGF